MSPRLGTVLVAFSAACFGSIPIAVTIAQRGGMPLNATLAWRYGIGALLLMLLLGRGGIAFRSARSIRPVVVMGAMQALVAAVSLSALRYIPAATLSFLFYTYPAMIAIMAAMRGTERLGPLRIGALALALAGIATMVGTPSAGTTHPTGVALALTSALLYALYVPIAGGYERTLGPMLTSTFAATGAALAFILAGAAAPGLTGGLAIPDVASGWLAVGFLAVFSTAVGFIAFLRGLAVLGAVRTAIISTVEPFVTALLGAAVLGQPLTRTTFIGGLLVATAVVVLQLGGTRIDASLQDTHERTAT